MMPTSGQESNGTLTRRIVAKDADEKKEHKDVQEEFVNGQNRSCVEKDIQLLQWEDMPKHLQFNPYVKTGYRPLLSAWGCIHSLFYLHNETVNILTHGEFFISSWLYREVHCFRFDTSTMTLRDSIPSCVTFNYD
jgi:hypothetical protein